MRIAILDFGTNTFNLLIAEEENGGFRRLYTGKQAVKLGKGGIHRGMIPEDAMERGLTAIERHMETVSGYNVDETVAYATSAFRNAVNGKSFAASIEERFGFPVHIITGDEEAELIHRGITSSVRMDHGKAMIMDIGGGSNELIICDSKQVFWKQSFELGMARVIEKFTLSDPVTRKEILEVESYFRSELGPLFESAEKFRPRILVGASGSFDTLAAMLKHALDRDTGDRTPMEIGLAQFHTLKEQLLASTLEERKKMPGMEPVRLEMIIPAVIFINLVLTDCNLRSVIQSDYALKEGVMARRIESRPKKNMH